MRKTKRNQAILQMVQKGETYTAIAKHFQVTPQRISQIMGHYLLPPSERRPRRSGKQIGEEEAFVKFALAHIRGVIFDIEMKLQINPEELRSLAELEKYKQLETAGNRILSRLFHELTS